MSVYPVKPGETRTLEVERLAFGGKGLTVGMAIGGIAGGMLGSYMFGGDNSRNTSPPDLQENRVQISTYGNMIPMLWGEGSWMKCSSSAEGSTFRGMWNSSSGGSNCGR